MQITHNNILSEILIIIKYPNKEKFIREFESLNHLDAMANLLPRLSYEVRDYIKKYYNHPEEIKRYIPQDKYLQEVTKVSVHALSQFIKSIEHTLSLEQKEKIVSLLSSS